MRVDFHLRNLAAIRPWAVAQFHLIFSLKHCFQNLEFPVYPSWSHLVCRLNQSGFERFFSFLSSWLRHVAQLLSSLQRNANLTKLIDSYFRLVCIHPVWKCDSNTLITFIITLKTLLLLLKLSSVLFSLLLLRRGGKFVLTRYRNVCSRRKSRRRSLQRKFISFLCQAGKKETDEKKQNQKSFHVIRTRKPPSRPIAPRRMSSRTSEIKNKYKRRK